MPYVKLSPPPGIIRPGTVYDAMGRWYDGTLVRWHDGVIQPWGGWTNLYASTGSGDRNTEPIRGMMSYQVDIVTRKRRLAYGTYQKAFQYAENASNYDITPVGFNAGSEHAVSSGGGTAEATCWSFDTLNSDLIAFGGMQDGDLYYLDYNSAVTVDLDLVSNHADYVSGIPTNNVGGIVVTPESFLFVLGADAFPRRVQWPDQGGYTAWTPSATNQAGAFDLPTNGWIQAGRKGRDLTLIWTDVDLWTARYTGGEFVYRFDLAGTECGSISRRSMAMVDGRAYWMGNRSFYSWDGFVRPMACPVGDYVFNRMTYLQRSKVCAVANSDFNEVVWYYPTGGGNAENTSYVAYNYALDIWSIGELARSDGIDRQFWENPILGATTGGLYSHENGTTYAEEDASTKTPYIESGPMELGEGDNVFMARQYVPDEETLGEVNTRLYSRIYPTASETTNGPYTNANPTDVRFTARQVRIRHTQVTAGWRVGTPRLEVTPGGLR